MKEIVEILKALSNETRLRIVNLLMNDELCICQIQGVLNMSQPLISGHIRILKQAGLLIARKDAQRTYYSLNRKNNKKLFIGINEKLEKYKEYREERKRAIEFPLCKGSMQ